MGVVATKMLDDPSKDIPWYRSAIPEQKSVELHKPNDLAGLLQAGGFLASLLGTALLALWCWYSLGLFWTSAFLTYLYGMQANYLINAMHELGHGTVFKTKWLHSLFLRPLSFLGWLHPDMFFSSHFRHHRYTQNFPQDQENPPPIRYRLKDFLLFAFVNGCYESINQCWRIAFNQYPTGWTPAWEDVCYPPDQPELRNVATLWGRTVLFGHLVILYLSLWSGRWLPTILFSLGPFYGGWLWFLCNSTQHVGLKQQNCRTFFLNPILRFYYWQMNWHIEHHMYAHVPCYNLAKLHEAIKPELPPTPDGIVETWKKIIAIQKLQDNDPAYYEDLSHLPRRKCS